MTKVLQATTRGQITLPKVWRDNFDTKYFLAEVKKGALILKPLETKKIKETLEDEVEKAWEEYQNGDYVDGDELMSKYGL